MTHIKVIKLNPIVYDLRSVFKLAWTCKNANYYGDKEEIDGMIAGVKDFMYK